jgi:hypothetical protein
MASSYSLLNGCGRQLVVRGRPKSTTGFPRAAGLQDRRAAGAGMGDRIGLDGMAQEMVEHLHVGGVNRDKRTSSRPDCPRDRADAGVVEEASARVATRSRIMGEPTPSWSAFRAA